MRLQAREAAPSILLLDELDALAGSREEGEGSGGSVTDRALSTLLNEMDGIGHGKDSVAGETPSVELRAGVNAGVNAGGC